MRSHIDVPAGPPERITAVLGPTNTGKTHFAMERMLAHGSGMIGFPLRLLARENYDRAVRAAGGHAVALVTGEEKIIPPTARYFLCTVEAMPVDREVEFLAIDEVQLAADPERGYVFTDRMLHARGTRETVLIGAETIRPLLNRLVPQAEVVTRPRFSRLTYAGPKKITRLPPRTAAVAFSAAEVYALAEVVRRRRGGAAVVLGALSPRTRNAQVEMFQAGEVDYLVATDAIGMGLNMDVNHIAFSDLVKFDGRMRRRLAPAEVGQIAGRAGRHMQDGTFGTTAAAPHFDPELIEAIESHTFEPLPFVFWRNPKLNFETVDTLIQSLALPPPSRDLVPAREAEDYRTLIALAGQPGLRARLDEAATVALLWECCQIPDFRKVMGDAHNSLVSRIFMDLTGDKGRISPAWIERQITRIDKTTGDIGALVGRIADIRTWTYVSHHSDWLDEPLRWQEQSRRIEDRLSDALHERLTERFVDKRTAVLVKRLRGKNELEAAVTASGDVLVEGLSIGRMEGFRFHSAPTAKGDDARAVRNAGWRALRPAIEERLTLLEACKPKAIKLGANGAVRWRGDVVGQLEKGSHLLQPSIRPLVGDGIDADIRDRVGAKLNGWLAAYLPFRLGALAKPPPPDLSGPARALLFQLTEVGGHLPRHRLRTVIDGLTKADRKALAAHGVKLGAQRVYMPDALRPAAQELLALLWALFNEKIFDSHPAFSASFPVDPALPAGLLPACGYVVSNGVAVRADRLEALWRAIRNGPEGKPEDKKRKPPASGTAADKINEKRATAEKPVNGNTGPALLRATPALGKAAGLPVDHLGAAFRALGYAPDPDVDGAFRKTARKPKRRQKESRPANPCSPFAILHELTASR